MEAFRSDRGPYRALNQLDEKLLSYVDRNRGFFIEAGASNGIEQSNTFYFEHERGWRGILIEPVPHRYQECRCNRPGSDVYCCALVPFGYEETFVPMTYGDLMSVAHHAANLLDDSEDHIDRAREHMPGEVPVTFGAVARTLSEIIDESGYTGNIDLLSLDVEGSELNALRGLDFERHRPEYILVEVRGDGEVEAYLKNRGYEHVDDLSHHDVLFRDRRP